MQLLGAMADTWNKQLAHNRFSELLKHDVSGLNVPDCGTATWSLFAEFFNGFSIGELQPPLLMPAYAPFYK
eukprot:scaffold492366_cov36-Prasinocladus_malaysianus.AAC.1